MITAIFILVGLSTITSHSMVALRGSLSGQAQGLNNVPRRSLMKYLRWFVIGLIVLVVIAILLFVAQRQRRAAFESGLRQAFEAMSAGEPYKALPILRGLNPGPANEAQVDYLIGYCDRGQGHFDQARIVWDVLQPHPSLAHDAGPALADRLIELGHYAEAERLVNEAIDKVESEDGLLAAKLRERLVVLFRLMGRRTELKPLIQTTWNEVATGGSSTDLAGISEPRNLLRQHTVADLEPPGVEQLRSQLNRAYQQAPKDEGVWLGLANLAILEGDFGAAHQWLDRFESQTSPRLPVISAQFRLAQAEEDLRGALDAVRDINFVNSDPERWVLVVAWLAEETGDRIRAIDAYRWILEGNPTDLSAMEKLAALLAESGRRQEAQDLRTRKGELDTLLNRYREQHYKANPATDGPTMAESAEQLGRYFEANAWWTLYAKANGHSDNSREALRRLETILANLDTRSRAIPIKFGHSGTLDRVRAATIVRDSVDRGSIPPVEFVESAAEAGLEFRHEPGRTPDRQLPETMSGGVALLDFDSDGSLDIFAVQGGQLRGDPLDQNDLGSRLYRNLGDGTFEDVTTSAGLGSVPSGYGHGVTVADFDQSGTPDLLITRLGSLLLLRNRGDGSFEDATTEVGLGGERGWPTSAAFADIDLDGDLDLYVAHYVAWDVNDPQRCPKPDGENSYCHPLVLEGTHDRLYRNDNGQFLDISEEAGIQIDPPGRGLGVLAADLDQDGMIDFYVANDATANFFFRNLGNGRFEESAEVAGLAGNSRGGYQAGMGIACGDLNADGLLDLVVTNFFGEGSTYYENLGSGIFTDRSESIGLYAATHSMLGFGTAFLDANSDGHLDLMTVNGHVDDFRPQFPYEMPTQLLLGDSRGRLHPIPDEIKSDPWIAPKLGRGLAVGDFDNDGRSDAVGLFQGNPLGLYMNHSTTGHHITISLEGKEANRDAIGALVRLRAGGKSFLLPRFGGGSYQSSSSSRLQIGLGEADGISDLQVTWPGGKEESFGSLAVDRHYRLRQGSGLAELVKKFE